MTCVITALWYRKEDKGGNKKTLKRYKTFKPAVHFYSRCVTAAQQLKQGHVPTWPHSDDWMNAALISPPTSGTSLCLLSKNNRGFIASLSRKLLPPVQTWVPPQTFLRLLWPRMWPRMLYWSFSCLHLVTFSSTSSRKLRPPPETQPYWAFVPAAAASQ